MIEYENGEREITYPRMLLPMLSDISCRTWAYENEEQPLKHDTHEQKRIREELKYLGYVVYEDKKIIEVGKDFDLKDLRVRARWYKQGLVLGNRCLPRLHWGLWDCVLDR